MLWSERHLFFLYNPLYRGAVGLTQPFSSGVKQVEHDSDHSSHLVARLRMSSSIPAVRHMLSCHAQGQCSFIFMYFSCRNQICFQK